MILSQKDWPVEFKSHANMRDFAIQRLRLDIQIEHALSFSYFYRDVLRNSKIFDFSKITDRKILNGEYAEIFLRTSYGLIAIGEGAVGLIEAKE